MKSTARQIALHGAAYGQNFGDVLILKLLADYLRSEAEAEIFFPFGRRAFSDASGEKVGGLFRLVRAHAAVMGPGGYFGERRTETESWNRRFRHYHGGFYKLIKIIKKPIFIHGVGVGPLSDQSSRELAVRIFEYARHISVRDIESRNWLLEWGISSEKVSVFPDVALTLMSQRKTYQSFANYHHEQSDDTPQVGLHLPLPKQLPASAHQSLILEISGLLKSQPNLQLLMLTDDPKQQINKDIITLVKAHGQATIADYISPGKLIADISSCDAVVTTKLHVAICASALGVAPLGLYWHPKVSRFFSMIGRARFCNDILNADGNWLAGCFDSDCIYSDQEFIKKVRVLSVEALEGLGRLSNAVFTSGK